LGLPDVHLSIYKVSDTINSSGFRQFIVVSHKYLTFLSTRYILSLSRKEKTYVY
jgi:hypothetical protein